MIVIFPIGEKSGNQLDILRYFEFNNNFRFLFFYRFRLLLRSGFSNIKIETRKVTFNFLFENYRLETTLTVFQLSYVTLRGPGPYIRNNTIRIPPSRGPFIIDNVRSISTGQDPRQILVCCCSGWTQ